MHADPHRPQRVLYQKPDHVLLGVHLRRGDQVRPLDLRVPGTSESCEDLILLLGIPVLVRPAQGGIGSENIRGCGNGSARRPGSGEDRQAMLERRVGGTQREHRGHLRQTTIVPDSQTLPSRPRPLVSTLAGRPHGSPGRQPQRERRAAGPAIRGSGVPAVGSPNRGRHLPQGLEPLVAWSSRRSSSGRCGHVHTLGRPGPDPTAGRYPPRAADRRRVSIRTAAGAGRRAGRRRGGRERQRARGRSSRVNDFKICLRFASIADPPRRDHRRSVSKPIPK